ncbi:MAG TPA: histidinol-phosphate transaminase [Bacteroidia bacterium]|nr:histidinol-phosphate transaminase [Bacteroidia bacterium]
MFDLNKIVRKNILNLKPYSSARDEFSGKDGVFLDANENPYGKLNRYPDPYQKDLKKKLSDLKSVKPENIFIGNGSDEVIDLCYRIFCNPSKDKALIFFPTYGMYEVSANINEVELINLPLDSSFQINFEALDNILIDESIKLIFVCSPNNPTGNAINNIDIVLRKFKGIVVVDEAYIDFSNTDSFIEKINKYPNLIVAQTFSKAWGLASARVGVAYANEKIIPILNKIKSPYNVSSLNQKAAIDTLDNYTIYKKQTSAILQQKRVLEKALKSISIVKKIYPSDANFILVEVEDANRVYNELVSKKLITRNRNSLVNNSIRITVGKPTENKQLIKALKEINL